MTDFYINRGFSQFRNRVLPKFRQHRSLLRVFGPDAGYTCEKCGHKAYWLSSNNIYICKRCEHQVSLTAGTIMLSFSSAVKSPANVVAGLKAKQSSW